MWHIVACLKVHNFQKLSFQSTHNSKKTGYLHENNYHFEVHPYRILMIAFATDYSDIPQKMLQTKTTAITETYTIPPPEDVSALFLKYHIMIEQ